MKPFWFIENCCFENDLTAQNILYAIKELGLESVVEKYVSFEGTDYSFLPTDSPVVFYGSLNAIRDYQKIENKCVPFAWCNWNLYRCQSYYTYYGEYLVQKKYGLYPVREIKRLKEFIFETYGKDNMVFIRPDENNKIFTGGLVKANSFDYWYRLATDCDQSADVLCVVGSPEILFSEYRLVVADGEVVAGSLYKKDMVLTVERYCPNELKALAEKLFQIWHPHAILVMDFCETPDGYKLIEIGPANAAGMYACDARPIVDAMNKIAIREFELAKRENEEKGKL